MKKFVGIVAAFFIGLVSLVVVTEPASATTYQPWKVQSNSSRALRAYDHIDQYGNPYGKSELRYAGQTFSRDTDWDIVTWAGKYACLRYNLNNTGWRTDCSTTGHHKISTNQYALLYTVER